MSWPPPVLAGHFSAHFKMHVKLLCLNIKAMPHPSFPQTYMTSGTRRHTEGRVFPAGLYPAGSDEVWGCDETQRAQEDPMWVECVLQQGHSGSLKKVKLGEEIVIDILLFLS